MREAFISDDFENDILPFIGELNYQSESESGFRFIKYPDIEYQDFESFFAPLVKVEEWHTEEEKKIRQNFMTLKKFLKKNLENLFVMKFGKVNKEIFITGTTEAGETIAIKTNSVET